MTEKQIKYNIEQNLIDFYLTWKSYQSVQYYENELFSAILNTKQKWPDYILNKKLSAINFTELLHAVNQQKQNENAPNYWLLNDEIALKNEAVLRKNFFFPVNVWVGMYLDKKTPFLVNDIEGLRLKKITQISELKEFSTIINTVVFKANMLTADMFKSKLEDQRFQLFTGKYQNEIVATIMTFTKGDNTGFYFLANKVAYRRRGFATLMLKKVLNICIENGDTKFVFHATKEGVSIYKRMGFVEFNRLITFASTGYLAANKNKKNE